MVGDAVNNDVMTGDIITAEQNRALPILPSSFGSTKRERDTGAPKDWSIHVYSFSFLFNSASLFKYSNFPVWAFVRRKTFWFVLPTSYLYYWLEWTHCVSSCRISGDLAPRSKSLMLFKMYCFHKDACTQPLSPLSHLFSVLLRVFLQHPCFISPSLTSLSAFLQDSERKGFMNKLYAIQDVCISVQNALDEVASYGERIKKWVVSPGPGTGPIPLCSACPSVLLLFFFLSLQCQVAPLPLASLSITQYCSQKTLPAWHWLFVHYISLNPAWPPNWMSHIYSLIIHCHLQLTIDTKRREGG